MILISLSFLLSLGCLQGVFMTASEDYFILDGNANLYRINSTDLSIEYTPVRPEQSSSGLYSGGEYCKKTITTEQYSILSQKVQGIVHNKKLRIQDRVKGSFSITIKKGKKEERFLIAKGGEEILALESYLKALIQ
jgi:hypothetical protein